MEKQTDEQLVTDILANPEKYGELIDRYESRLRRHVSRITSLEDETVDEILQMVFIKAYKNLAGFRTSLKFSSWIYRIAHNEAIDVTRKNKHTVVSIDANDDDSQSLLDKIASSDDVGCEATRTESLEAVSKIFSKMPDKYREVLILHFLEDKSYEQISDILRKPMGTVATLINRAKKQFKAGASDPEYQCLFSS